MPQNEPIPDYESIIKGLEEQLAKAAKAEPVTTATDGSTSKESSVDIPTVIDYQCKDYARMIKAEHSDYIIKDWNGYKAPFVFATNGRKYLKQIELKLVQCQ
ncbi:MAG: hypothetical protein ACI4J3_09110 [Oscillospiraceae bacterium]